MKIRGSCKHTSTPEHNVNAQIKLEDLNDDFAKSALLHRSSCSASKTVAMTRRSSIISSSSGSSISGSSKRSFRVTKVTKLKHVFIPLTKIKQRIQQQQKQPIQYQQKQPIQYQQEQPIQQQQQQEQEQPTQQLQQQLQQQPTQTKKEKTINAALIPPPTSSSSSSSSSHLLQDVNIIQLRKYHSKNEDIKNLISYIVDDRMDIPAAAKKVNMALTTANMYYNRYLKDPQHKIPTSQKANHPKTAFFFNNFEYIKGLYDIDPKMGIIKLESLLTAAFPHVYITTMLLEYIHRKMRCSKRQVIPLSNHASSSEDKKINKNSISNNTNHFISNNTNNNNNTNDEKRIMKMEKRIVARNRYLKYRDSRKFTEEQVEFLKNMMLNQPGLPFYKLNRRLRERFADVRVESRVLSAYIRTNLSDVYQRTRNAKQKTRDLNAQEKTEQTYIQEKLQYQIKTQDHSGAMLKKQQQQQPVLSKSKIRKSSSKNNINNNNSNSNNNDNKNRNNDDDGLYQPALTENEIKFTAKVLYEQKIKEKIKDLFNDEQRQYLAILVEAYPLLPVYRLRWKLLERFPALTVRYQRLAEYLRLELKRPPALTEKTAQRKLPGYQKIFIENQVFMEPTPDLQAIFCKVVRKFPDYNTSYYRFTSYIKANYPVRYQQRKSYKQQGCNDELTIEHTEFLRNLFKNDDLDTPTVSLISAHASLLRAFPDVIVSFSAVQTCVFKMRL